MLIEPAGVLHGPEGQAAREALGALPLQGGRSVFTLVRDVSAASGSFVPVPAAPRAWRDAIDRLACLPAGLDVPGPPEIMGILNVTPDSFSDGGRNFVPDDAVRSGLDMIGAGASLLDVGGESTRPGATPVSPEAEQARILPVLRRLRGQGARVCVDTRHAGTMQAALDAGADMINDVSALSHDPAAAAVLARFDCPVVLSHMRGTPATMAGLARYDDVAADVVRELGERIEQAVAAGIARARILVDPGIGFAKDAAQNLELLRRLPILAALGCRVMLGTSRKRFIGSVAAASDPAGRDPGSIVSSLPALAFPSPVLRVHDVAGMAQAVAVQQALAEDPDSHRQDFKGLPLMGFQGQRP